MRDLSLELHAIGHDITVVIPDPTLPLLYSEEQYSGVSVVRLRTPKAKDIGHKRRALMELFMPRIMKMLWQRTSQCKTRFDAVVWYSPSIFFGPFIRELKKQSSCPAYMIIRDIFPDWAIDMGLIKPGLAHRILKAIAQQQYREADVVGVQTAGNLLYFKTWTEQGMNRRAEVLPNWLASAASKACSIDVSSTKLGGRKILVYAGNMGVAQGMDMILSLMRVFKNRSDVGFLCVGRGAEALRLRETCVTEGLENSLFYDEIDPDEIPSLYRQCDIGLVSLDARHKSHNIPGKFISYMQAGLPVLASINPGNDLEKLIHDYNVGRCDAAADIKQFAHLADDLLIEIAADSIPIRNRCVNLFNERFAACTVAQQLIDSLHKALVDRNQGRTSQTGNRHQRI